MNNTSIITKTPLWLLIVAALGIAWNVFGTVQFVGTVNHTPESLMMGGMTSGQAQVYFGLPAWTKVAFATGVFGGVAGAVLLALRRRPAVAVLLVSLVAYVALWFGDMAYGVFAVLPNQMAILSMVVAIAVLLFGIALSARSRGQLR